MATRIVVMATAIGDQVAVFVSNNKYGVSQCPGLTALASSLQSMVKLRRATPLFRKSGHMGHVTNLKRACS